MCGMVVLCLATPLCLTVSGYLIILPSVLVGAENLAIEKFPSWFFVILLHAELV